MLSLWTQNGLKTLYIFSDILFKPISVIDLLLLILLKLLLVLLELLVLLITSSTLESIISSVWMTSSLKILFPASISTSD